jgi:hypothetical protein
MHRSLSGFVASRKLIWVFLIALIVGCQGNVLEPSTAESSHSGNLNEAAASPTESIVTEIPGSSLSQPTAEPAPTSPISISSDVADPSPSEPSSWRATGSMIYGRMLHTSTLLPNGKVLTVGGFNRLAEVYDPETGSWSRTADSINTFRSATATALSDGHVLVAGAGGAEWNSGITAALYDAATASWTATGTMVTPRFYHTATLLQDGRVLVSGGANGEYGGNVLALAELYDPASGTWSATGAMSAARSHHTTTLLRDGRVLVTGGADGSGARLDSAEVYNPQTGTWSSAGAMTVARSYHATALLPDGRVLVTGGGGPDWASSASVELFDPATNTWTAAASMARPRRQHSATLLPTGHVLVAGGFHEYTGIQTSTEAYDPSSGTWAPAGNMTADRYQHSATLLANGLLFITGGFSNADQSSSELLKPYFQTVLKEGNHWKLININGVMDDTGQPYATNLYTVQDLDGVEQSPLPDGIKQELADSASAGNSVSVVSQWIVEEIRISEENGQLTPALQAIAEPLDPLAAATPGPKGPFGSCSDHIINKGKTFGIATPYSKSTNLGNGFTGSFSLNGNAQGSATGEVQVKVKRHKTLWVCVPYAAEFDYAHASGSMSLTYGTTLSGTVSYANPAPWEIEVAKPFLFDLFFFAGPIPIYIGFKLPIKVGLELKASITGSVTYSGSQSASGQFDYTCTLNGCSGTANYTQSGPPTSQPVTASISGRIQPSAYAQVALRAYLYAEWVAYAQVGVRPYLRGDLWGYYGNNCGDADGDGTLETVDALTFDLDLQVHLTGQVGAGGMDLKEWDDLLHTKRHHLAFWDLIGSRALRPMLSGSASVPANSTQQYGARMRPCWPYTDAVDYQLAWGEGSPTNFSGAPATTTYATHAWAQPGTYGLGLTALRDSHGRGFNATTSRDIQVTGSPVTVNLALGAASSASSTYCSGTGLNCYFPSRINDGSASTVLGGFSSWANDDLGLPQWVQLDFGGPRTFARIELYTTSGYELQDYRLEAWIGNSWVTLAIVTGNTQVHRTHQFPAVTGTKLRVMGLKGPNVQTNYARVNEVEVYAN